MAITKIYPFTTPANYTYNTNEILVDGEASLLNKTPTGASSWATYTADINLNAGGGVLTGVAVGGAAVNAGKLDLSFNDARHVDYDADLNADSQQTGCIRFKLTPNYSGTPAASQCFFNISKADNDTDNRITIFHLITTGNLRITIGSDTGANIVSADLGVWNPTASTEYEIELNYDITTGETRLFIDGVQFGATQADTGTRDSLIALCRIGNNQASAFTSNFLIADVVFFDAVQHITDYAHGYTLPETVYLTTDPVITTVEVIETDGLVSFSETSTKAGSDEIKYILLKDGTKYYYNVGWVLSDGTYAQANTAAEIDTNKATFTAVSIDLTIDILLHSDDGATTPSIDNLDIEYSFATPAGEDVKTTILWWDAKQNDGAEETETTSIVLTNNAIKYLTRTTIMQESITITPVNGTYEVAIVDTENMELDTEGNEQTYTLTVGTKTYTLRIPQLDSVNLYDAGIIV